MKNINKHQSLLSAFFIPIGIFVLGLLLNKIYPFGDKILLMLDGYNQYPGFLNSFIEFIKGHQSILYSFKGLIGFNLYATSVYYSLNITNLFFIFFKNIVNFYTFIIPLKIGLASLTMCLFLNYIKKNKYNFIFSICYGLTAYNLLYYLNYMWFDSIILLPLVILGIEKIFKENNYLFYTITLSLSIISNFYIGYMICIFSVIYFIYKWLVNNHTKNDLFKYILYSLLAGLISSFILIPVTLELLNGKGTLISNYTSNYFKFDLDFLNIFYKLTIGSFINGDLEYGTPNVYVSLFIYINTILYFFNQNIKLKEKIFSGIIIIIFFLSMSFNLLDYFWQMMQMPIWYPVRYAFIFDFYLIYIAFKNYQNYNYPSLKKNIFIFIIMFIMIIIGFITSGNLHDKINISAKIIYLFISIIFILYYFFILNSKEFKKYIWIVVIIELSLNTFITLRNNGNNNTITEFNNTYTMNKEILNTIKINNTDRIIFDDKTIKNNGLLLNYNDINFFSSVRNQSTINLLKNLGILTIDDCNINYYYNNPIINALLGIKYYITEDTLNYYDLISTYNSINIYQNNDATSLGFITNSDILRLEFTDDYKENINNLVKTINNNNKDILKEIPAKDKNISCSETMCITNGNTGYINYEFTVNKDALIIIQNDYKTGQDKTKYILNNKKISNHYPIKINKGEKVTITINPYEDFKDYNYHIFEIDINIYEEYINNINKNKLKITDYYNDSHFKGTISLEEESILFTTISNDNGWIVYVDGKKHKITKLLSSTIGIKLDKGTHEIEFKYTPPGLKIGVIISSISLITLVGISIKKKLRT